MHRKDRGDTASSVEIQYRRSFSGKDMLRRVKSGIKLGENGLSVYFDMQVCKGSIVLIISLPLKVRTSHKFLWCILTPENLIF